MPTKLRPELDIWVYPLEAVQVPGAAPLTLVDKLSALPREPEGEQRSSDPPWWRPAVDEGGVVSGSPELWCQPGKLYDIHGLRWWDFTDPVTGQQVGLFTLAPHFLAWLTYIDDPRQALMLPTAKWFLYGFKRLRGYFWQNVTPDDGEEAQAIAWYANGGPGAEYTITDESGNQQTERLEALPEDHSAPYGGAVYIAQSVHQQPRDQSFAVKLWLGAPAPGTAPWVRIAWADNRYSVLLQQGLPPVLSVGHPGTGLYWRRADMAREASGDWFPSREPIWVAVFHIAGRILVRIWGGKHDYTLIYGGIRYDSQGGKRGMATPVRVSSPPGHVSVSGAWAPVVLRMYEVLWGLRAPYRTHEEGEGPDRRLVVDRWQILNIGWFRRRFHAWRRSGKPKGYALGDPASYGRARGASRAFLERHSTARVEVGEPGFESSESADIDRTILELLLGRPVSRPDRGVLEYKCTLGTGAGYPLELYSEDSEDGADQEDESLQGSNDMPMRGCTTPAVHSVVVHYASAWRKTSVSPLNIRPAVVSASETVEDPMLAPGPSWRLRLARELLPDCELEDGTPIGDSWPQYVQRYHPVKVDVRWRMSDGSATPTVRRLEGYVWRRDIEARPGPAQREASVELRDWSMRLQRPAGVVDGRFPPLDAVLFMNAERASAGAMPRIYGAHAVRAILENALGPDIAARLEYYYRTASLDWRLLDGDIGWMPLLDYRIITGDIPSAGFWFPPPWGRSVLDWIRQIADYDVGVFFFAWSWTKAAFVPMYGNYFAVVQNAPTHTLSADDLDPNQPVEEAQISQVSEHDINRILIWGRLPGGDRSYRDVMPALALISAEARIESGSPIPEQNIDQTWERTLVKEGTQYWLPRVAQVVAHVALKLYRGVEVARYVLRTRGIPELWWGHKVQIAAPGPAADPWVNELAGKAFRVMRIHNEYDLQRGLWESRVNVVPQPSLE